MSTEATAAPTLTTNVRLDDENRALTVEALTVVDPDVYAHFRPLPPGDWEAEVERALSLGVAVIDRVAHSSDVDFVERRMTQLLDDVETALEEMSGGFVREVDARFDPGESDSHTARINELIETKRNQLLDELRRIKEELRQDQAKHRKELADRFDPDRKTSYLARVRKEVDSFEQRVGAMFDPERRDSVPGLLRTELDRTFSDNGQLSSILDRHLSLSNPDGPLAQIQREIAGVREDLAAHEAAQEVVQRNPEKGQDFEDQVESTLEAVASNFVGDWVEDVRHEGTRKGDYLYHTAEGPLIGIEARDRTIASAPKLREELDTILRDRDAEYALYVVASPDQLQAQMGMWDEYEGDKAVTSLDLLPLALKVGRLRIRASVNGDGVNIEAITEQLRSARVALKKLSQIKKEARRSRASGKKILAVAKGLKDAVEECLAGIEEAISESTSA